MRALMVAAWLSAVILTSASARADLLDGDVVFSGFPFHAVVVENPAEPFPMEIPMEKRNELRLEISFQGGNYVWATRKNEKLIHAGRGGGLFRTWVAANGSGYIRIVPQSTVDPEADSTEYMYVEHLVNKLGSFTYWGKGHLAVKIED